MSKVFSIIILCLLGFLVIGCQSKSNQDKLDELLQDNPELMRQLENELRESINHQLLRNLEASEIPKAIIGHFGDSTRLDVCLVDMDGDQIDEFIVIAKQSTYEKLAIIRQNRTEFQYYETEWLEGVSKVQNTSLNTMFGILEWRRNLHLETKTINQKLKIESNPRENDFDLIKIEEEILSYSEKGDLLESQTHIHDYKLGFFKKKCILYRQSQIVQGVPIEKDIKKKDVSLSMISDGYLDSIRPMIGCKSEQ